MILAIKIQTEFHPPPSPKWSSSSSVDREQNARKWREFHIPRYTVYGTYIKVFSQKHKGFKHSWPNMIIYIVWCILEDYRKPLNSSPPQSNLIYFEILAEAPVSAWLRSGQPVCREKRQRGQR